MNKLVLASASPRRKQLLAVLGFKFEVVTADVDEKFCEGEDPGKLAIRLAESKAWHVYQSYPESCRVIGGDTVVSLENQILGKPENREQAIDMLNLLSDETHSVFSAVSLVENNQCQSRLSESRVTFRPLSVEEIQAYCDTSDPYDKAGAYGIQGGAGGFVSRLEGSYSGVVGFPLWEVHTLLFDQPQC